MLNLLLGFGLLGTALILGLAAYYLFSRSVTTEEEDDLFELAEYERIGDE